MTKKNNKIKTKFAFFKFICSKNKSIRKEKKTRKKNKTKIQICLLVIV